MLSLGWEGGLCLITEYSSSCICSRLVLYKSLKNWKRHQKEFYSTKKCSAGQNYLVLNNILT